MRARLKAALAEIEVHDPDDAALVLIEGAADEIRRALWSSTPGGEVREPSVPLLMEWRNAVRDSDLKLTTAKRQRLFIDDIADHLAKFPSKETIAADCGLSSRAVDSAVKRLESSLVVDQRVAWPFLE